MYLTKHRFLQFLHTKAAESLTGNKRCKINVHIHYITDQTLTPIESFLSLYGLILRLPKPEKQSVQKMYWSIPVTFTPSYLLQSILLSCTLELSETKVKFCYYKPLSTNALTPQVEGHCGRSTIITTAFQRFLPYS